MFEIPFLLERGTLYTELGVGPEVLAEELREAKKEAITALDEERTAWQKEMRAIEAVVPGLADARQALKDMQTKPGSPAEIEAARAQLAGREDVAVRLKPGYRDLLQRAPEFDRRTVRVNQITIDNPEERRKYNREHPPLALLELDDATCDEFVGNRTAVPLLRRELSRYCAAHGEAVFHPSDFEREDFSADFTPHPLLDA